MAKWLFTILFIPAFFMAYSQSDSSNTQIDTTIYLVKLHTGQEYKCKILELRYERFITVMKEDSSVVSFPWSIISSYQKLVRHTDNVLYPKLAPGDSVYSAQGVKKPWTPAHLLTKKRSGVALIVIGTVLLAAGSAMIAGGSPSTRQTYNGNGRAGVNFTGVAAVGFVIDLAAIPMMIVGAVRLSRANLYIRQARENAERLKQ